MLATLSIAIVTSIFVRDSKYVLTSRIHKLVLFNTVFLTEYCQFDCRMSNWFQRYCHSELSIYLNLFSFSYSFFRRIKILCRDSFQILINNVINSLEKDEKFYHWKSLVLQRNLFDLQIYLIVRPSWLLSWSRNRGMYSNQNGNWV